MFLDLHEIIKKPLVTERSSLLREQNKYVFIVNTKASKTQIKDAVEAFFKVKVTDVHTMIKSGKARRRFSPQAGYQPDVKKAIVTLRKGDEIKIAEPK